MKMNSKKNKKLNKKSEEIEKENKEKEKESELVAKDEKENQPKSKKQMFERNKKTKFVYNQIMRRMDNYAFARTICLYGLLCFYLGNNHDLFIWLFSILHIYVFLYRYLRFWVRRYLLYCFEFCYFGSLLTVFFILYDPKNMILFSTCFNCNTGVMTLAAVLFNNQSDFECTDQLTTSWIHTLPLIVDWSIR